VNLKFTHLFDELSWNAPVYLDGCMSNLKEFSFFQINNTTIQMLYFAINNDSIFHVMIMWHDI
jgi:hypothetical protein